jgi:hypothetical protein
MTSFPTAPVAAGGLVGGYAAARLTKRREWGGAVLAVAGFWCGRSWLRSSGPVRTAALLTTYVLGFGLSHPLAKRLGAWPSVVTVAAVTAGASYAVADRSAD